MRRDAVFATLVAEQARDWGYPVITVDETMSVADAVKRADPSLRSPNI
jgi:hypothetical protein